MTPAAITATTTAWDITATVTLLLLELVQLVWYFLIGILKHFDQIVNTFRVFLRD